MDLRKSAPLVLLACLPAAVGCGGGKSQAEKAKDAAVQATAACQIFTTLKTPSGTGKAQQIQYAKVSAAAFAKAAGMAKTAAAEDSTWAKLASSSKAEADSFAIIVKASTQGVTSRAEQQNVLRAVEIAKGARPVFIGECAKADPAHFTPVPTPSVTATATALATSTPTDGKNL